MSENALFQEAPLDTDARQWAMLCHLSAVLGWLMPLGNLILPVVLWQMRKGRDAFINEQGKESVNFQVSALLAMVVGSACLISSASFLVTIGLLVIVVVAIAMLVLPIIAGVKANKGHHYRYPFTWRLIK